MSKGIRKVFSEVPYTYELVNHILTWGLDILWRRKAAKVATMEGGTRWIDICSGTGEMAVYLSRLAKRKTMVVAADFSIPMISKAIVKPEADQIVFILADANVLPFRDGTFDLVTIAFATRNINVSRNILFQCFREFYRILKPGGRLVNLETSQPSSRLVRGLFHLYVRLAVRPLGYIISGSRAGYAYLSHTIPRFYSAGEFVDIIRHIGFVEVTFNHMMLGASAIHKAIK